MLPVTKAIATLNDIAQRFWHKIVANIPIFRFRLAPVTFFSGWIWQRTFYRITIAPWVIGRTMGSSCFS